MSFDDSNKEPQKDSANSKDKNRDRTDRRSTPRHKPKKPKKEATEDPTASMFQETHQPIERNLDEARQLLQLSRHEGRDPLQDATVGRLALDRLDTIADGDPDTQKAKWADLLRRELKERFNEIAPTKFEIGAS